MKKNVGRVTIPTDVDVIPQTIELMERWGADAVRDCDGTDFPEELKDVDVLLNIGDADTAHTGGSWWENPVGEPGDRQPYQGVRIYRRWIYRRR